MDYSPCFFSKIGSFFKMLITQKIQVGISSNFLHSIRTSICIRKCNKNWGRFLGHFLEKTIGYNIEYFKNQQIYMYWLYCCNKQKTIIIYTI